MQKPLLVWISTFPFVEKERSELELFFELQIHSILPTQWTQAPSLLCLPLNHPGSSEIPPLKKTFFIRYSPTPQPSLLEKGEGKNPFYFIHLEPKNSILPFLYKLLHPKPPKIVHQRVWEENWFFPTGETPLLTSLLTQKPWLPRQDSLKKIPTLLKKLVVSPQAFAFQFYEQTIGTQSTLIVQGSGSFPELKTFLTPLLSEVNWVRIRTYDQSQESDWTLGFSELSPTTSSFPHLAFEPKPHRLTALASPIDLKKSERKDAQTAVDPELQRTLALYQKQFSEIQLQIREGEIQLKRLQFQRRSHKVLKVSQEPSLIEQITDLRQKLEAWIHQEKKILQKLDTWMKDHPLFFKNKK